jgi:hypothetical protein
MIQDKFDALNLCIGLVEDLYGPQESYEELVDVLNSEFPQEEFTLDMVVEFYSVSHEIEEKRIFLAQL